MGFNIKKLGILLTAVTGALAGVGTECEFVNQLMGKSDSFDCCSFGYPKIKCSSDHITYINLSDSDITGGLPSSLSRLEGLVVLNLQRNKISGSIPDLSNLKNLVELRLNNNQLSSSIPSSIGNLNNLKVLDLSNNRLEGAIPGGIYNLARLTDIKLESNNLSGKLSDDIDKLKNLRVLNVKGNTLTGQIPRYIGELSSLTALDLSNNKFEKEIPSSIGNLNNLQILRLENNELSGEFPTASIEKIKTLTEIDLSGNSKLYGSSPTLKFATVNYHCDFQRTQLCYNRGDVNNKCEYARYDCTKCVENSKFSDRVCRCKDGYSGIGYVSCTPQSEVDDQNLHKDDSKNSASTLKASLSSIAINVLVIVASLIIYNY